MTASCALTRCQSPDPANLVDLSPVLGLLSGLSPLGRVELSGRSPRTRSTIQKGTSMAGTTVITFGTFDVFHVGHVRVLNRAAEFGDRLLVGVSSDQLNLAKKGRRPVFTQDERMEIISNIKVVDGVFVEESLELKRHYIEEHQADVLVMGDDWA